MQSRFSSSICFSLFVLATVAGCGSAVDTPLSSQSEDLVSTCQTCPHGPPPNIFACGTIDTAACTTGAPCVDATLVDIDGTCLKRPPPPPVQTLPTFEQMASQGLSWFSGFLTNGQIDHGENLDRLTNDGGMVWHDANTAEMLADYQIATGDKTYQSTLEAYRGFDGRYIMGNNNGINLNFNVGPIAVNTGENNFNDDKLWWALTMIRIYDALGDPAYLANAETIFDNVCKYWTAETTDKMECGGGITWTENGHYMNAIANELFFTTAAKLAQRDPARQNVCSDKISMTSVGPVALFGTITKMIPTVQSPGAAITRTWDNTYLGWAVAEWEWFKEHWFPAQTTPEAFTQVAPPRATGNLPIKDGLGDDCIPGHPRQDPGTDGVWTYNQGVILGGLLDLATIARTGKDTTHIIPDAPGTLLQLAFTVASTTMMDFALGPILTEHNDGFDSNGNPVNGCMGQDCPQFKGVFMRYLGRLYKEVPTSTQGYATFAPNALDFLVHNAEQVWRMGVKEGSAFPEKWTIAQSVPSPYYQTTQTAALDAIIAAIGQHAAATPVVNP